MIFSYEYFDGAKGSQYLGIGREKKKKKRKIRLWQLRPARPEHS